MGFFISFEGIEGSGKSTQIEALRHHLETAGHHVLTTREPGGCPIANAIRAILLDPANAGMVPRAELLLYAAARAQHVEEVILPALKRGVTVLCDRFTDATIAYQGGGRCLSTELVHDLNRIATAGLHPDLTLLLDLPVETGLMRARSRNHLTAMQCEGRFELEEFDFHRQVRDAYMTLAAHDNRFRIVDATGDEACVSARVTAAVDAFLASRPLAQLS